MSPDPIHDLAPAELAQLMRFYAESGVEWLIEDEPQDRFAEYARMEAARARPVASSAAGDAAAREAPPAVTVRPPARPAPPVTAGPLPAIPDGQAIAEAGRMAAAATSVAELEAAVADFSGCNLRNSARNTAFVLPNPHARIVVLGGTPSGDDDRDGVPFSGATGAMLRMMLAGIGLAAEDVLLANLIPWRPPGNRAPTPHEIETCRPFGMRLLEIVRPRAVLVMGNLPAKALFGTSEGIHAVRGRWTDIATPAAPIPALATFHPQDLLAAPICKKLAWRDLLDFKDALTN